MEAWISLLALDSQTSSQVISEENLREIFKGLKKCDTLSEDSFSILVNALSEKATCFESRPIPPDFYNVLGCLCRHLTKRKDLPPEDVRSFFSPFVEAILKASPEALVPIFEHMLEAFHAEIIDPKCNIYIKYSILAGLNEISIFPSTTKVELFLKPNIHGIYTSLASNLRSLGDYDTQAQLLEFLLHVIPAARRKNFVEEYLHHGLSDPFCSIIGQQFEVAARRFLNIINPVDPITQTVFSIPCISVRLCDHELQCQPTALKSNDEPCWVDFNLVSERITTYCVLSLRSDSVYDIEEGEQTWETISIHPEVIEEVNVSSIRLESDDGSSGEQIALSIAISEPTSNFSRFWEGGNGADTANGKSIIEFFLNPPDIVTALPEETNKSNHGDQTQQQQQLIKLLKGLRGYAERMFPRATTASSQSSTDCQQQQPGVQFGTKVIFASCRSPLCVEVGTENTPSPLPKSFFADPNISFEESAEGLGLKTTGSGDRRRHSMSLFRCQTVRTPLSLRVGPDGIEERRRGSPSTIPIATPSSRPVNSPFSVASGLETPSPCRKPLEAPNLGAVDTSPDEDIASESVRMVPTVKNPQKAVETSLTQSDSETDYPQTPISMATGQVSKGFTSATNLGFAMGGILRRGDVCDLDEISATETEETPQSQSCVSKARKRAWRKPPSAEHPVSPIKEAPQKGDVYDLDEISDRENADLQPETKRANLSTFEHFVEENKLDLRQKGNLETPETCGRDLVEDIVAVLGSAAKRPMRRCRRSIRLAKMAEKRVEAAPLVLGFLLPSFSILPGLKNPPAHRLLQQSLAASTAPATVVGKDDDGSDDNRASDEDPDKEVLAGSMDVMGHQAVVILSPLLNTPMSPLAPSQEGILVDENSIKKKELPTSKQPNSDEELVLNQCSLVQDSRTPLESTQPFHPGPENVNAAHLLKVVSPPYTPPTALVEVHLDKTPSETICQLSVESFLESPERARRTAVVSDNEKHVHLLPAVIPKALSPQIEEDFVPKSGVDVDSAKHKACRLHAVPFVDLDDSKPSLQQPTPPNSAKQVTINANAFLSPIQRPLSSTRRCRRQSRASTAASTILTTTVTTDASSMPEDSQTVNRSAPSPMVMSPYQRLEAAVQALESEVKGAPELVAPSADLRTSKRLWDTTATYLADESPCPNAVDIQIQGGQPPLPSFGNKYFSIAAKTRGDRKSTGKEVAARGQSTKSGASPSHGRRFFASTFAERNKREVEKRFFEVVQKKTANVTDKQKKKKSGGRQQQRKSTSKKREKKGGDSPDAQMSNLEDLDGAGKEDEVAFRPSKHAAGAVVDDDSGCRLQSRPAIRRAAAIARNRILETSLDELKYSDLSAPSSALSSPMPATRKAAVMKGMKATEARAPGGSSLDTSRRPTLDLFAPTPNTSGVYDFTLSEDDELVRGLPRLSRRNRKGGLKGLFPLPATTLAHPSQQIISTGLITDISRCVGVVFSTLNIVESEFANRLNQLRDQVEEMQRLLRCWQRHHPEEAGGTKMEGNRLHV